MFKRKNDSLDLGVRILHPIGGPDADDRPVEGFQDFLAEPVSIPRGRGTVVRRAVALDPQEESTGAFGVHQSQVDPKAAAPDLPLYRKTSTGERVGDFLLERRIVIEFVDLGDFRAQGGDSSLGEVEVVTKELGTDRLRSGQVDVVRLEGTDDRHRKSRASHGDVEASLATHEIQGTEPHGDPPILVGSIADAEEDHAPLVTLDVLQILHKEGLFDSLLEELFHLGLESP